MRAMNFLRLMWETQTPGFSPARGGMLFVAFAFIKAAMKENSLSLVYLVREPRESLPAAPPPLLILLHGIGSNEHDLLSLAPYLDGRFLIVSVRAPIVMGQAAYGWFNIEFTPQGIRADVEQAERSLKMLSGFVDELIEAYPVNRQCVYLMGFSQGAMMSLSLTLAQPEKVAGLVAMSGRFPAQQILEPTGERRALENLPILITHGIYDPVLPIEHGREIRRALASLPVQLTYREYPMGHEVNLESLRDVSIWLTETLDARCTGKEM